MQAKHRSMRAREKTWVGGPGLEYRDRHAERAHDEVRAEEEEEARCAEAAEEAALLKHVAQRDHVLAKRRVDAVRKIEGGREEADERRGEDDGLFEGMMPAVVVECKHRDEELRH